MTRRVTASCLKRKKSSTFDKTQNRHSFFILSSSLSSPSHRTTTDLGSFTDCFKLLSEKMVNEHTSLLSDAKEGVSEKCCCVCVCVCVCDENENMFCILVRKDSFAFFAYLTQFLLSSPYL